MQIIVDINEEVNVGELRKAITFVSEDILSYDIGENSIILDVKDDADKNEIEESFRNVIKKYKKVNKSVKDKVLFVNNRNEQRYFENILDNEESFLNMGDGLVQLRGKALFLYDFFDNDFLNIGIDMGAVIKRYPILLPIEEYRKTGYLHNSPQYAIFCSSLHENFNELEMLESYIDKNDTKELMNNPNLALSPAACFHAYFEVKNQTLEGNCMVTLINDVFRNEGRLNYSEVGRLKDFHVREIVFFGDKDYVTDNRNKCIEIVENRLKLWGLESNIEVASDAFVMPKMQKFKMIQMLEKSKYEINMNLTKDKAISVGSFNFHGTAFTSPFNIKIKGCELPVTGCVGFGIERWVIAFLSQYGFDENNWPQAIRDSFLASRGYV